eukprot:554281-Prorocentrum_minimum.AAC.1
MCFTHFGCRSRKGSVTWAHHGACLHPGAGAVGACPRWRRASRACWLSQRDVLLSGAGVGQLWGDQAWVSKSDSEEVCLAALMAEVVLSSRADGTWT